MGNFKEDVFCVLQHKQYEKHCHALGALLDTIEYHRASSDSKVRFYKYFGLFLLTAIPLLSAILSAFIAKKDLFPSGLQDFVVFGLSLAITLLTILNSIFIPSFRYREACLIGVGIESFKEEILVELEQIKVVDEHKLLEYIGKKRKEFEDFKVRLISMYMPMEVAAQLNSAAGAKKRSEKHKSKANSGGSHQPSTDAPHKKNH